MKYKLTSIIKGSLSLSKCTCKVFRDTKKFVDLMVFFRKVMVEILLKNLKTSKSHFICVVSALVSVVSHIEKI
jgi:hypothetical protein